MSTRPFLIGAALLAGLVVSARMLWPERSTGRVPDGPPEARVLSRLRAPEGATVTRFAGEVPNVRLLRVTPAGDLLASMPRAGRIVLLRPDAVQTLVSGLDRPHGIDWRDGWLFIAESDAVRRIRFDPATRETKGTPETVVSGLPSGGNHWTRTLRFGPDGWMYVSVGSSCNVCFEKDPRRAAIVRYRPDGSGEEIFASGLRNAVGFDWRPGTDEMYATDNGRDYLGDDLPPCELDLVVRGGFYGWPVANGNRVPDPDHGRGHEKDIARSIPSVHAFRAHNAPLGITFLRGERLPAPYRGAALVALHGSWNRTKKDGYKVVSLHWGPGGTISERDFLTGFLENDDVIGRPVDVAEGADGAIYVSDDHGGAVFRVAFGEGAKGGSTPPPSTGETVTAAPRPRPPFAAAAIEHGRVLYKRHKCATCHEAKPPKPGVKPLRGLSERYTAVSLAELLRVPTPPMPAPDLTAAERNDLAAFLLSR